jgi:predicted phosphodiesterase
MRLHIASDLHLEFVQRDHPTSRTIEPVEADVLILAGDIHSGKKGVEQFSDWPTPVIMVHGNHELYHNDYDETIKAMRSAAKGSVHFLENDEVVIDGVRFLGCCLWTDYDLYRQPALAMIRAGNALNDHRVVRYKNRAFKPADALAIHIASRAWLESKLAEPFDGKTVVVTHHGVNSRSVHHQYGTDSLNAAFSSDLSSLMGRATVFVHGHTHNSFYYEDNGSQVIVNPCGYPRNSSSQDPKSIRFENIEFDRSLVIEI